MKYKIFETDEFDEWNQKQTAKSRVQIAKRIDKIKEDGHFVSM